MDTARERLHFLRFLRFLRRLRQSALAALPLLKGFAQACEGYARARGLA